MAATPHYYVSALKAQRLSGQVKVSALVRQSEDLVSVLRSGLALRAALSFDPRSAAA